MSDVEPTLDDVIDPQEKVVRHPDQHAKADPRPDDDRLAARTQQEREMVREQQEG